MIILKIVLFGLLIIGAIYCIAKIFIGKKVLQVNSKLGTCPIEITENGFYSLWIKGKLFKRTGVDVRNVKIYDVNNKAKKSFFAIFKPKTNGISQGSMMLKYYYLKKGTYDFTVGEGKESGLNILDNLLILALPKTKQPKHSYILKKTLPDFIIIFVIPVIPFSAMQIIESIQLLNN